VPRRTFAQEKPMFSPPEPQALANILGRNLAGMVFGPLLSLTLGKKLLTIY
jgi:hypothetical protein